MAIDIDTFFDHNHDCGSIAPNLVDHPGPQAIHDVLCQVRDRPDVSSVSALIRVEADEYIDGEWPFCEAIQVVTSATTADLDAITAPVHTDAAFEAPWGPAINTPAIPDSQRVVTIWWD